MGQFRPNWSVRTTSAFLPLAIRQRTSRDVSNVPIPEVAGLFHHLVVAGEETERDSKTETLAAFKLRVSLYLIGAHSAPD